MKRLIQNSILAILAIALVIGILWARNKSRGEVCTNVEVQVVNADSTSFVTPQGVLNDLKGQGIKVVGKHMGDIDASEIEEALRLSPYLESADIVKCMDGKLLIRVNQLVPVFRVFDGESSYYVNRAGKHMSASNYYHSDVPVVQGHFNRKYPSTRLLPLIDYVEGDSLLHSLVTMYIVRDTNNIILVPNISGHVINIGNKFSDLISLIFLIGLSDESTHEITAFEFLAPYAITCPVYDHRRHRSKSICKIPDQCSTGRREPLTFFRTSKNRQPLDNISRSRGRHWKFAMCAMNSSESCAES